MLIRCNEKGKWFKDFFLSPQGFESFQSDLPRARCRNIVCVECLQMIRSMVVGFCFIGVWCYTRVWVWNLIRLTQFQGSEMSPGLFQYFMDVYKTLRLSALLVEHGVVVMSVRLNPIGSQSLISVLWNSFGISGTWNFETELRTPTLAVRVQLSFGWNTILTWFSILILWTLCGKPMWERQKALLC